MIGNDYSSRDRREVVDDYFQKRKNDQAKERILRYVMTSDARDKASNVKWSDVDLYDRFRDTVINLYHMKYLGRNDMDLPKFRQIMGKVAEFRRKEERAQIGRNIL